MSLIGRGSRNDDHPELERIDMRLLLVSLTAVALTSCSVLTGTDEAETIDLSGQWATDPSSESTPLRMEVTEARDGNVVGTGFVEARDSAQFTVSGQRERRQVPMNFRFDSTMVRFRDTWIRTDQCGDAAIDGSLIRDGDTASTRFIRSACR